MRFALSRVAVVVAVAALGAGGCSGGGSSKSSGAKGSSGLVGGKSGDASAPGGATLDGEVPSGFSKSTAWSTTVQWTAKGVGLPTIGSELQGVDDETIAKQQGGFGVARTVGDSVVVASFASGGAAGPVLTTLKFLDAKTGKSLAEKKLPAGTFLGISADTVAGKPVAVVRYLAAQDDKTPVVVVFDASGAQVWSSQGQQLATGTGLQGAAGLAHDEGGARLIVGGYMLRTNLGKDTDFNTDASYDVLDTSGKSVLHVPMYADKADENGVKILQGYAVVIHNNSYSLPDSSQAKTQFTVYDLAAGGKKVGELEEKGAGGSALVAYHGKILLTWSGKSEAGSTGGQVIVLDTATGQTTPPFDMPSTGESTMIDPATSNVMFYDTGDVPNASAMVSLSQGKVLWTQSDHHGALIPLAMHNGVVYGNEAAELGSTDGGPVAVKETDGTPADSTKFDLSPLDFTAGGAPLFAEVSPDTDTGASKVTVGVGRGA